MTFCKAHVYVSGRVQGVRYRAAVSEKARRLKLAGWVRNLPDGRVEALAEGKRESIEELIKWMKLGPLLARVEDLSVTFEQYSGEFVSFDVLR